MVVLRDRYQIIRQIGQGGFGKTYLVEDLDRLKEPCVVKQLSPQVGSSDALQKAVELFEDEAKRLRDLGEHPQIPMLYAYFEEDRNFYLVQQFIEGKNLAEDLEEQGLYDEREIINLLTKLLPVLKFVHQRQVIHRDIKPENIIRSNDDRLVLVDFGASKYLTSPILKTGTVIGTAGYVSPEQAVGKPVFSSDLYSLGVTCIHWKQADELTAQFIEQISSRNFRINKEDIEKFPCQDLEIISHLWSEYTNGHFGFSVQKRIWFKCGGDINKFRKQVGWSTWAGLRSYLNLIFNLNAPEGHLPAKWLDSSVPLFGGGRSWASFANNENIAYLMLRLEICKIN